MNLEGVSQEVETYINRVMEQRKNEGILGAEECQKILAYAAESKSEVLFGLGYYYFAEHCWVENDGEKTMHCLTECTKYFQTAQMYEFLARTYNMLGAVSDSRNNKAVALNYYYLGLQCAEKYRFSYVLGMITSNIAHILVRMKQFEGALALYLRSVEQYEEAEDGLFLNYNMTESMAHAGSCYLWLGEKRKAYELLERIEQIKKEQPDRIYSEISIEIFRGECFVAQDKREESLQCISAILGFLEDESSLGDISGRLANISALLLHFDAYDEMEKLFRKIAALETENRTVLFMDMYPYWSKALLSKNRMEEYVECTEQYFQAYEKDKENGRQVAARIMELQDRFRSVEKEQERMIASNRMLEALALYDSMTNLANRTLFNEQESRKFEEAQKQGKLFGVELLDIDFFKQYNDRYGHLAGDACIEAVASVLRGLGDERVFCGRYGGDEFVIIYSNMTPEEIEEIAKRIQSSIREKKIAHGASECSDIITVSQGIFVKVPEELNREWDFNAMADTALYCAKRAGKNRYHIETSFGNR